MPYLPMVERDYVDAGEQLKTAGQLNYKLFKYTRLPFDRTRDDTLIYFYNAALNLFEHTNKNYQGANDVAGALLLCKFEFARRTSDRSHSYAMIQEVFDSVIDKFYKDVVAPYEDIKIKENGDVSGPKKC